MIALMLWSAVLVTALFSLAGLLAPVLPFWEITNHFRPFYLLASIVLSVVAFLVSRKLTYVAVLILGLNFTLILPALLNQAHEQPHTKQLKIMTWNVWVGNSKVEKVATYIRRINPDVLLLQELTYKNRTRLGKLLKADYPFQQACALVASCGVSFYSKLKWKDIKQVPYRRNNAPLVHAVFGEDNPFHIIATHTAWPFHANKQVRDLEWLARYVKKTKHPVILAGDLNLSPWSWKLWKLQNKTGFMRHTTFMFTWPAHILFPVVQLDHILTSPSIGYVSTQVGKAHGSDHLPVISVVGLPH